MRNGKHEEKGGQDSQLGKLTTLQIPTLLQGFDSQRSGCRPTRHITNRERNNKIIMASSERYPSFESSDPCNYFNLRINKSMFTRFCNIVWFLLMQPSKMIGSRGLRQIPKFRISPNVIRPITLRRELFVNGRRSHQYIIHHCSNQNSIGAVIKNWLPPMETQTCVDRSNCLAHHDDSTYFRSWKSDVNYEEDCKWY